MQTVLRAGSALKILVLSLFLSSVTVQAQVSISGTVWNDFDNSAAGTFTGIRTGTEAGTNASGTLYVILRDVSGLVVQYAVVSNAGTYQFNNVPVNTNYSLLLTKNVVLPGNISPAAVLPGDPEDWEYTSPAVTSAFNSGTGNITGKDFGVERRPIANDFTPASQSNPGGTASVYVPALSGKDAEDGTIGFGKPFVISSLPSNATLKYNGVAVTAGQVISSYNSSLLTVDPDDGASVVVTFTYTVRDRGGLEDMTPATVTMSFTSALACTAGIIYAVSFQTESPDAGAQRRLHTVDPTTGVYSPSPGVDLFPSTGLTSGLTSGARQTTAIALDVATNKLYYVTRESGSSHIFEMNLNNNTVTRSWVFNNPAATSIHNKAAFNFVDRKLYIHEGSSNMLFSFDPATGGAGNGNTVSVTSLGALSYPGSVNGNLSGGDITFDAVGAMYGAFYNGDVVMKFPPTYNSSNVYTGPSSAGYNIGNITSMPLLAGIAFVENGDIITSGNGVGFSTINTDNVAITATANSTTATGDLSSCVVPKPLLVVSNDVAYNCPSIPGGPGTISYTIKITNTGNLFADSVKLFDTLQSGLTYTSATLNGTTIPGANPFASGFLLKSPGSSALSGEVERNQTATIVINASVSNGLISSNSRIRNQGYVTYSGIKSEASSGSNFKIESDNPKTSAASDPTDVYPSCNIVLSGTAWLDANNSGGGTFSNINGAGEAGSNAGGSLYAILTTSSGTVIQSTAVASNGTYTFSNVAANMDVSIIISNVPGVPTQTAPLSVLPSGWVNTSPRVMYLNTGTGNSVSLDFGIEQAPVADVKSYTIGAAEFSFNPPGSFPYIPNYKTILTNNSALTGYAQGGSLTGSDAEDCPAVSSCNTGKTFKVQLVDANTLLYYDYGGSTGIQPVVTGTLIPNFNASKLAIYGRYNTGTIATGQISFLYSLLDIGAIESAASAYTITTNVPLPVELLSFGVKAEGCYNTAVWTTATEYNTDHFEIWQSENSSPYNMAGIVQSKGSNSHYEHKIPVSGGSYSYYLKSVDVNMAYAESARKWVFNSCGTDAAKPVLFPNPADNTVSVSCSDPESVTRVSVYNMLGTECIRREGAAIDFAAFDLSGLIPGVYIIAVEQAGYVYSCKLVKN